MNVSVILLAGGVGNRMGHATPKQFLPLGGVAVARHSFDLFLEYPEISQIVVVAEECYHHLFLAAKSKAVCFAPPGPRRQDSVFNGLQRIDATSKYIAIHDSARPMIDLPLIDRTLAAAKEYGAATAAVPLKATVKIANDNGLVVNTPDRSKMWEVQTPQVIERELLVSGFANINAKGITVTDDVSIVELMGHSVKLVMGDYRNIKITTPEDLTILESLLL